MELESVEKNGKKRSQEPMDLKIANEKNGQELTEEKKTFSF